MPNLVSVDESEADALYPDFLLREKRCLICYIRTIECSHTGLVPDSPTFFNSSPFKVLSPQPPKFLKSLLPVKEENKAKKALEARPLLGQEVSRKELKCLPGGGVFLCLFFSLDSLQSHISSFCQTPFSHDILTSDYISTACYVCWHWQK